MTHRPIGTKDPRTTTRAMIRPLRRRLKPASRGQTSAGSSLSWGAWMGTARPTRGTR